MSNCMDLCATGLFQGSEYCCGTPPQGGVTDEMTLFNWDNIDTVVYDGNGIITDIILKQGTKAYKFLGTNGSNVPQATYAPTTYISQFDHQVQFVAFQTDQLSKKNYETLANKPVVCIIEKSKGRTQGGDDSFEVFGIGVGMRLSELTYIPGDAESGGTYLIIVKSSDNLAKESKLPTSFFDTDYVTTKAKISSYWNLPSIVNISPLAWLVAGGTATEITGSGFFQDGSSIVTSVQAISSSNVATTITHTVVSNTKITVAGTPALAAGTYSVRVTTSNGATQSTAIIVVA